jgi:exodeoxyribonuclease VII large subunit
LSRSRERIGDLRERAQRAFAQGLLRRRDRLDASWTLARSLGPEAVLARGYALVRDEAGALIRSAGQALPGAGLTVKVSDGAFAVTVAGGSDASPRLARPARRDTRPAGQGDLF